MISIHCTSQPNIRIKNRQVNNRARESDPARKEAVRIWSIGKKCTCGCGEPANCAHHPSDDLYGDEWVDLSQCEPWQSFCHHMHHKGFVRCPGCGGWMRKGAEKCAKCRNPRPYNERRKRTRHPCGKNLGRQRCKDGRICARSPAKAEGCDYFIKREVMA